MSSIERKHIDQRDSFFSACPPAALRVVGRPGRNVAHKDARQIADIDAQLHCWSADQYIRFPRFEAPLDFDSPGACQLRRMLVRQHPIGRAIHVRLDVVVLLWSRVVGFQPAFAPPAGTDSPHVMGRHAPAAAAPKERFGHLQHHAPVVHHLDLLRRSLVPDVARHQEPFGHQELHQIR